MARRTRAESDATAAQVLAAASSLFASDGYGGVGLEKVAHAAGVTRGAVYHHFTSKKGLFTAVLAQAHSDVARDVVAAAERARATSADPWLALEAGCRAFLDVSSAAPTRQILLIDGPAVVGWDDWRCYDAASSGRHLDEALNELADHGQLAPANVAATAALLSGAMNEGALWVASQPPAHRQRALDDAWTVLGRLLGALRATDAVS